MLQQSSARQDICEAIFKIKKVSKKGNEEFQLKTLKPVYQQNSGRETKNN